MNNKLTGENYFEDVVGQLLTARQAEEIKIPVDFKNDLRNGLIARAQTMGQDSRENFSASSFAYQWKYLLALASSVTVITVVFVNIFNGINSGKDQAKDMLISQTPGAESGTPEAVPAAEFNEMVSTDLQTSLYAFDARTVMPPKEVLENYYQKQGIIADQNDAVKMLADDIGKPDISFYLPINNESSLAVPMSVESKPVDGGSVVEPQNDLPVVEERSSLITTVFTNSFPEQLVPSAKTATPNSTNQNEESKVLEPVEEQVVNLTLVTNEATYNQKAIPPQSKNAPEIDTMSEATQMTEEVVSAGAAISTERNEGQEMIEDTAESPVINTLTAVPAVETQQQEKKNVQNSQKTTTPKVQIALTYPKKQTVNIYDMNKYYVVKFAEGEVKSQVSVIDALLDYQGKDRAQLMALLDNYLMSKEIRLLRTFSAITVEKAAGKTRYVFWVRNAQETLPIGFWDI